MNVPLHVQVLVAHVYVFTCNLKIHQCIIMFALYPAISMQRILSTEILSQTVSCHFCR